MTGSRASGNPVVRVCICGILVAAFALAAVDTSRDSPKELARALGRKAARAEKNGDSAQAYILYSEAAALQPTNRRLKSRMELLRTGAVKQSKPSSAASAASSEQHVVLLPEQIFDSLTERELAQARELQSVPRLAARAGKQNFDLTGDPRVLFQRVAQSFGLDPVFDGDYPPSAAAVRFRVDDVDYREALTCLQAATASFVIPISSRVFMVAKDTQPKRNDLEQTMLIAVPLPQVITPQEITEIAQVVRQTTNIEKIAWDTTQSRLVIRDRVSRVIPALEILRQLLAYRPEVMIEMEFLQVSASDIRNYGFNITNTFTGIYLGHILNNAISIPTSVTGLLSFGGGKTLIGLGVAQAQAMFNETSNTSNSLYRAQIRSLVGQPATLHVGEKYPVITGGYFGGASGQQSGSSTYLSPPIFTYEDLGLEMKVTPFVHSTDEVTLAIETSFEVLTGQSINDIPVIGRRSIASQARLRNGEWAVIGGLMNTSKSKGVNGFWGLGQIPLLGYLFKQTSTDLEDSNVLIGIKPHLLSLPPDQIVTRALRTGTELHPYIPL